MTEPRNSHDERAQEDEEPKVDAEVIHDLDSPAEDLDDILGGTCQATCGEGSRCTQRSMLTK